MIVESCPVGPVGADDENAEDEKDEDVVDLVVLGPDDEAGETDQETDSNTDVHIPGTKDGLDKSPLAETHLCSFRLSSLVWQRT